MSAPGKGQILVAAGTNGAGKSSIVQPFIERNGGFYFNPDHYTRDLVAKGVPADQANALAWQKGFKLLRKSIDGGLRFAFETTLGGNSIHAELLRALARGCTVSIVYVGLESPEMHIQRVAERVARGGHDIPEPKIRERYTRSLENLARFIGTPASMTVFDNSRQTDDGRPNPLELFCISNGRFEFGPMPADAMMGWAKPLVLRAAEFYEIPGLEAEARSPAQTSSD